MPTMDSSITRWILAALLSAPILSGPGGISADPVNGTGIPSSGPQVGTSSTEPAADVLPVLAEKGWVDESDRDLERGPGGRGTFLDNEALRSRQTGPSSATASDQNDGFSSTGSPMKYPSAGVTLPKRESPLCVECGLPSHSHSEEQRGGIELRKKPVKRGAASVADSQEDSGSGDPHVRMPARQITSSAGKQWTEEEFLDRATASPSRTTAPWSKGLPGPSTDKTLSPDSAEIDHLLQVSRETALQPPSGPEGSKKEENSEAGKADGLGQGAQGSSDIAMGTEKTPGGPLSSSLPPIDPLKPSDPPVHPPVTDLIDIDYYDSLDAHGPLGHFPGSSFPGGDATKRFHGRHPPREPELYEEEISPFDDSYFYPTTSFYADGDDDGENEDDDDENEEPGDEKNDGARSVREPETGRAAKDATQAPKVKTAMAEERPTSRQRVPHQTFILYGGELHPDINKDFTQTSPGAGDNSTECRNGYVKRNNSCKSLCDIYPAYCHNGGQCYIVETMGAFCRCNTQDYIWHKGLRCESIITDFQVMCVAVGTAALVVLLLFMMTVFFAKKLYLLKTENYKLRKRNRYRTPSELHNDNFSLSTIAEGSHPNEDPNAPQKVQDLPKACLKDEEPFNIQNSLSPKHESGKGDPDIADVNCVLNNLT